jgi:NADH-quinone oxidoreductase subunit G
LLHTHYHNRRRSEGEISFASGNGAVKKVHVDVCVGTTCFIRGSQKVLQQLLAHVDENVLQDQVEVAASFCKEHCGQGPNITIDDREHPHCTGDCALKLVQDRIDEANARKTGSAS